MRIPLRHAAEFPQLLAGHIRLDFEGHANLLKTVAHLLVDAEESAEIDVALN